MSDNDDCVFCKLLSGELEVSMVHHDAICSAFMHIQPLTPGHVLVVPRRHAPDLANLYEEEGAQMFRVAQRVAAVLRRCGVKCEGVNFFLADDVAAGQEVFHVHLHVFPRYQGDGFGLKIPPEYHQRPPREELNELAKSIQVALKENSG